jgi:hypothetical protein
MSLTVSCTQPANSLSGFHLLARPSGAIYNIDCKILFFLVGRGAIFQRGNTCNGSASVRSKQMTPNSNFRLLMHFL